MYKSLSLWVSHISAPRALAGGGEGVKGHSAMTDQAVQRRPQSSSFLLPTFSWSRPLKLRMKPVKPSSCGGSRQISGHNRKPFLLFCVFFFFFLKISVPFQISPTAQRGEKSTHTRSKHRKVGAGWHAGNPISKFRYLAQQSHDHNWTNHDCGTF